MNWYSESALGGIPLHALLLKTCVGRSLCRFCHAVCLHHTCAHQVPELSVRLSHVCNVLDRPHCQSAAQRHEVCGEEDYVALQQHFCAMVVANATEGSEEANEEAANGAQQWLGVVEQAASRAEACGLRKLKAQMILLAYYGLFDVHRHSAALADVCPR